MRKMAAEQRPRPTRTRMACRRAGGAYLLILGVSSVLMVIGLAAASVARIDNKNVAAWFERMQGRPSASA